MNRTLRLLALAELRQRHPDEPPDHHRRRIAGLLLHKALEEAACS
jgi:hypothetical protein